MHVRVYVLFLLADASCYEYQCRTAGTGCTGSVVPHSAALRVRRGTVRSRWPAQFKRRRAQPPMTDKNKTLLKGRAGGEKKSRRRLSQNGHKRVSGQSHPSGRGCDGQHFGLTTTTFDHAQPVYACMCVYMSCFCSQTLAATSTSAELPGGLHRLRRSPRRCTQGAPWDGTEPVAGAIQKAPGSAPKCS